MRTQVEAELLVEQNVRVQHGARIDVLVFATAVAGVGRKQARVVTLLDDDERYAGLEVRVDLETRFTNAAQLLVQNLENA